MADNKGMEATTTTDDEVCEGCECSECECGPQDDSWINRAYEAQADAREFRRVQESERIHWLLTD